MKKIFTCIVLFFVTISAAMAWNKHGVPAFYNPDTDPALVGNIVADFDAANASTITITAGKVSAWASSVGSAVATPLSSSAPTYSATARNGTPGLSFTGTITERMGFSATGMPTGTSPSTVIVVAYNNSAGNTVAAGYGGGVTSYDSRRIDASSSTNLVQLGYFGAQAVSTTSWASTDNIVIGNFISPGIGAAMVNGGDPVATQWASNFVTTTAKGRIGVSTTDTGGAWSGVIQRAIFINRALTQLEQDKITGYLAWRYNLTSLLPSTYPYKTVAPLTTSTLTSDLLSSYVLKWSDNFSALSLKVGGYWQGNTTGYNTPGNKGTWSFNGHNYMTSPQAYVDFGYGQFINGNFNWQATDPNFPPLGMADITSAGLVLNSSSSYPLVRAALPLASGFTPFLSVLLSTTQSMKIGVPFAFRYTYTNNTFGPADFPAVWELDERYNGSLPVTASVDATGIMTVTALGTPPTGNTAGIQPLMTVAGGSLPFEQVMAYGTNGTTGTGGTGTYQLTHAPTAQSSQTFQIAYQHEEIDQFEEFGFDWVNTMQSQTTHVPLGNDHCGNFNMGVVQRPNVQHQVVGIHTASFIYLYTDGILTCKTANTQGDPSLTNRYHGVVNYASGKSYEPYPGSFQGYISGNVLTATTVNAATMRINAGANLSNSGVTAGTTIATYGSGGTTGTGLTGTYQLNNSMTIGSAGSPVTFLVDGVITTSTMTVRSFEVFAPASNTTGLFPAAYPVPVVTWSPCCTGGVVPVSTPTGTTIGTLSGATSYSVIPYISTFTNLTVSGSNLQTSGSLSVGNYDYYIKGVAADGTPGIAPHATLSVQ